MHTTYMATPAELDRKWYVIDAQGMPLGRLATRVAHILRGKHKPAFTPHLDCGDHVIVVNAGKIVLTGDKLNQKEYITYTGYPSGLRRTSYRNLMATRPERAVEHAVRGMLPKNRLGRVMIRKLKVYKGAEHPHQAQKPEALAL